MRNTYCKDMNGKEIFEGDIVGIYSWETQVIDDAELIEQAAGRYRVIFKYNEFRLEEVLPNWFHKPYGPISNYTILKVIEP